MHLKVVRDEFTSSCVTSDACNVHSSRLALAMRQNSGLSIYLLCSLVFPFYYFFYCFLDEAIVQSTLLLTAFLSDMSLYVCLRDTSACA